MFKLIGSQANHESHTCVHHKQLISCFMKPPCPTHAMAIVSKHEQCPWDHLDQLETMAGTDQLQTMALATRCSPQHIQDIDEGEGVSNYTVAYVYGFRRARRLRVLRCWLGGAGISAHGLSAPGHQPTAAGAQAFLRPRVIMTVSEGASGAAWFLIQDLGRVGQPVPRSQTWSCRFSS